MGKIKLLHGSDHIIEKPDLLLGKTNNDYGRGFYCTQELSMAMEWACKKNSDGFVNKYVLEQDSLNILNLLDGKYNILHWMALLLKNRTFRLSNEIAIDACDYIIENFSIDLKAYDVIIGYRADDSYFSFAESFVQNGLPLRSLNEALHLGRLGTQYRNPNADNLLLIHRRHKLRMKIPILYILKFKKFCLYIFYYVFLVHDFPF